MRRRALAALLLAACTGDSEWTYGGVPSIDSRVIAINLVTGEQALVSGASRGAGPAYAMMTAAALDEAGQRLLITNAAPEWAVFAVDLATGDRTTISDSLTGSGPVLSPSGIALDPSSGRAFVINRSEVIAVDLASGDRTEVSGPSVGSGPPIVLATAIALHVAGNRAFVADNASDAIFSVDLSTGDRTVVSDAVTGGGPLYTHMAGIAFDAAFPRLLVIDNDSGFLIGALFAVDPATGDRETISDAATGSGPAMESPWDVVLDPARNRVLVIDHGRLFGIRLDSGVRSTLAEPVGLGALALDAARTRVLVATVGS
jgi:DNA-binding beta-propeller fold protein YncE